MKDTKDHVFNPEQSTQLRAHVHEQAKAVTQASLALAHALFETYYGRTKDKGEHLAIAWGFESFEHYCEKELLTHGGTCRSYVRVYDELCVKRSFDELELPPAITALRELAKVSKRLKTKSEFEPWVKRSHKITACELRAEVEAFLYGKGGKRRHLGFHMQWAAAGRCMKRIREAREVLGLATNGEALERILTDYSVGKRAPSELRRTG